MSIGAFKIWAKKRNHGRVVINVDMEFIPIKTLTVILASRSVV